MGDIPESTWMNAPIPPALLTSCIEKDPPDRPVLLATHCLAAGQAWQFKSNPSGSRAVCGE